MPSPDDCHMLQALFEAVDAARREAETTWGAERLPLLVDDETRAAIYRQTANWSRAYATAWEAINAGRPVTRDMIEAVQKRAAAMQRMYPRLAELAAEAGHRPLHPQVWETLLADGSVVAVVQTNDDAAHVIASGRHVNVYTLAEVAHVIDALPGALQMAKVVWPGAKLLGQGDRKWVKDGDPLPFGEVA